MILRFLGWSAAILAGFLYVWGGLSRVSFDVEILKLLPSNLSQVQGLNLFLHHFSRPEELIVSVEVGDAEELPAAVAKVSARLKSRSELVGQVVSTPPWEESPSDLAELLAFQLINQSPDRVAFPGTLRRRC